MDVATNHACEVETKDILRHCCNDCCGFLTRPCPCIFGLIEPTMCMFKYMRRLWQHVLDVRCHVVFPSGSHDFSLVALTHGAWRGRRGARRSHCGDTLARVRLAARVHLQPSHVRVFSCALRGFGLPSDCAHLCIPVYPYTEPLSCPLLRAAFARYRAGAHVVRVGSPER